MSELRSTLEQFQAENLAALPDGVLEDDLIELHRAAEILEVERLRRLAEVDHRRPYLRDGYLSTASWFADRTRASHSAAAADVRSARAMEAMAGTRDALASGEISASAVRVLMAARDADPEAFAEGEALLLEAARRHSVPDLQRVLGHWRNAVESRRLAMEGDEGLRERRRLHVSSTVFGMVRIDGDLDPETGEVVLTTLRSWLDSEMRSTDPDDRRTPAQRRADALGEVCRHWLDYGERPEVAGERPHVTVTVDLEALEDRLRGACELDQSGPVHPEAARRIACDASISRVVLSAKSEPLDVGRRTSVVPAPLRRAVVIRDRHCRFPGCDRPHSWCDAHHVVHWASGGSTALFNLILLCRRHHRLVHQGFRIELANGAPIFHRPDGTVLAERAPP